ncbi:GlxA family transcriptional regulator [Tropicibacter naphthalenivorans]|uniref:Carnitine catabolism transcriptional activator n=1 Tax=Tropicibacter naphthalenivorans TaxID=441103 RepID=A0A0P1G604_9RHOB|nr:helix-turn-helix domain-containing protein [Tropicibacter naphthalenivorans]CUH77168.1 Carnitine catabolism transcriptional activator [Tropicibacter naphthalenivorans]SMC60198.1 transcriptional regulator, AraC family with amidase-like domain [Tropicibacter naphthalenivorans]
MHICLILFPGFHMLAYALVVQVLRLANLCAGQQLFTWDVLSMTGQAVSEDGLSVPAPAADWTAAPGYDLVLLCAGARALDHLPMGLRSFLIQADRAGATLGGIEAGGLVLARLGLLAGREAVIDLSATPGFTEKFPDVALSPRSFCYDRRRLTTGGGLAAGDAMLAWVGRVQSTALAVQVAESLERGHLRDTGQTQRLSQTSDPVLDRMQAIMATHLDDPLPLERIAEELDLSLKQLRRICRQTLNKTPAQIYLEMRLERAQQLVQDTDLPVSDVAQATGFASPSAFTRSYKALYKEPPRSTRAARR